MKESWQPVRREYSESLCRAVRHYWFNVLGDFCSYLRGGTFFKSNVCGVGRIN